MGPVSIAEADRVRLIEMLTDEQNWYTPNTPVFNTVPNYYEYRLRFKRAGDVLDFDLGWHATAFFNNRIVAGDAWSLNGRDRVFALLESVIASKSPPSRPAAATHAPTEQTQRKPNDEWSRGHVPASGSGCVARTASASRARRRGIRRPTVHDRPRVTGGAAVRGCACGIGRISRTSRRGPVA